MKPFVFSGDGHIREPADLYSNSLSASLRQHAIHSKRDGDYIGTYAGDRLIIRSRVANDRRPQFAEGKGNLGRPSIKGATDLSERIKDLDSEGIDGEILFPTVAMFAFLVEHVDAEIASARAYNDWLHGFIGDQAHRFVKCGIVPIRDFDAGVAEMERLAGMGFTSVMLPSSIPPGVPNYNHESWDKLFDAAQRLQMVLALHTATGRADVKPERGPGGAIVNYTDQMRDAIQSIMYLVAGGVLDRFPKSQVVVVESGASWLAGLAERMDEVYEAHFNFVNPKLSVRPSEIIQRQISATFQYDRACIMSRSVTGTRGLIWGSDYPHTEGTFPHSREVLAHLFDGIDIGEQEKADIVGLNGARLFRLPHPELAMPA